MIEASSFGQWLKRRRRQLDMTQQALADCAGCSVVTIRKFEADERRPSKQLAVLLAGCLGIAAPEQEQFINFARSLETSLPIISPPRPSDNPPIPNSRLPAPLTPLFGREEEVAAIIAIWRQSTVRLLTLTGPGGAGKTRLALAAARRLAADAEIFPDGVAFVDLSAVHDPDLVLPSIATNLDLKESLGQNVAVGLAAYLQRRSLLLVLDNFEQIVEATPQIYHLLRSAEKLSILVTSRVPLHLLGEHEFPVMPLSLPASLDWAETADYRRYPALVLFVEQAKAMKPDFALTPENQSVVVEICRRLDGLPLAIELAAARIKFLPPAALLAQLATSLSLSTPNRSITDRQRTLRGAIEWSFNLLEENEQRLFAHLGVFSGPFTLAAVNGIHHPAPGETLLEMMLTLVDKNMVQLVETAVPIGASSFSLLLTLREYAQEQLALGGELDRVRADHAHFYLSLAQEAAANYQGPDLSLWLHRLETAHDNFRNALSWNIEQPDRMGNGLTLAVALTQFWQIRNHLAEGRRWFDRILPNATAVSAALQAEAHHAAGVLAYYYQDYAAAEASLHTSLDLLTSLGSLDNAAAAATLNLLGNVAWARETYKVAAGYYEQSLPIYQRLDNRQQIAKTLHNLGLVEQYQANYEIGRQYYLKSLAIDRSVGDQLGILVNLNSLGTLSQELADYPAAQSYLLESLALAQEIDNKVQVAMILGNLGNVAVPEGRLAEAREFYETGLALATEAESPNFIAMNSFGLGILAMLANDDTTALPLLLKALETWRIYSNKRLIVRALDVFSLLFCRQDHCGEAMSLLGFAETLRRNKLVPPRAPAFKPFYEQALALAKSRLEADAFDRAWDFGRSLTLDEALTLALKSHDIVGGVAESHISSQDVELANGRFQPEELIAVGGMGELYRGLDHITGQTVVIKRLRPELIYPGSEMVARFSREGELLRKLNHPNIVKFLAVETVSGRVHLIMEYVPGGSLRELLLTQSRLSINQALTMTLELADALSRAHHLGIIHRDLKPENILLAADGSPRLSDFGIAYEIYHQTRLTQPGVVMGTVSYLSPEGCQGAELNRGSDVWSLGVLLFEMLAGQNPFTTDSIAATMLAILHQPLPDLTAIRPDAPSALIALTNNMLAKQPANRLSSMRQVAAELERIRQTIVF